MRKKEIERVKKIGDKNAKRFCKKYLKNGFKPFLDEDSDLDVQDLVQSALECYQNIGKTKIGKLILENEELSMLYAYQWGIVTQKKLLEIYEKEKLCLEEELAQQ